MIKAITTILIFLHLLVQGNAYTMGYYGGGSVYDKMPVMTSDASEPAHRSYTLSRVGGYGYMGYDNYYGGGMGRYNDYYGGGYGRGGYGGGYGYGSYSPYMNGYSNYGYGSGYNSYGGMGRYNDYYGGGYNRGYGSMYGGGYGYGSGYGSGYGNYGYGGYSPYGYGSGYGNYGMGGYGMGNSYYGLSSYYRPYESDKLARVSRWTGSDSRMGYGSYGMGYGGGYGYGMGYGGGYSPYYYGNYGGYSNGRMNTGFYNNGYYNPMNSYYNRDPYAMNRGYNMNWGSSWKSPLSPDDITSRKSYFDWQA